MNDLVLFQSFARGSKSQTIRSSNCVIYTRVSTKEQADNNMSLDTQRKACEGFAKRQGYNIPGYFGGTYESGKKRVQSHALLCKEEQGESSLHHCL